jgi:2-polyprenyl-3-methyl-5-hydroxy-6-metoxy-1,4-benzoquinol methylase
MLDRIIEAAKNTSYDFRKTANLNDPLIHLFDDWFSYYRLKWAIAHIIKPESILEIGVRYGYSAAAFLNGNPNANYVGIDLDTDSYGGVKGAVNWAKEITQPFNTNFIIANTQSMKSFPGGTYDLIHVDGQQDGDSSFHDLELAISQSKYVLVDGYLWTKQNFLAVSDFLFQHSNLIDFYGVIPGYAGDLLIKVAGDRCKEIDFRKDKHISSSLTVQNAYVTNYYTQDCGGFDTFIKNQGKVLEDSRLQAVVAIASLKEKGTEQQSVLDIGCGRGELTYYFAKQDFNVTAIDYSQSAIELSQKCFDDEESPSSNVQFLCEDVCKVTLSEKYDLALASDVIEHLSHSEVDTLYQKVSHHLKPDGLFVVHTFPNLWFYKYNYPHKRRIAASIGAYLPLEPRSRYELIMHINEQSPRTLKNQLRQNFEYSYTWFADPSNPGGSLVKKFSRAEMRAAPSLFAVASHQPINLDYLKERLQASRIPSIFARKIKLVVVDHPEKIKASSEFYIKLEIQNHSGFMLCSYGSNPIHISYHWMNEAATNYITFGGERTKIFPLLGHSKPKHIRLFSKDVAKETYRVRVKAPIDMGTYVLRVTLVQEGVRWFDQFPTRLSKDITVKLGR